MGNSETEATAIARVLEVERQAGRTPEDVRSSGLPYDVSSPPRKIEMKAFGGSARGLAIPLEDRQYQAAMQDPEHFYLYVVDNVAKADEGRMRVRVVHGTALRDMLARSRPHITYWPTFRVDEYDAADQM
ncbi:protein NO VEIN domain-containing protein [Micromonospora sp. SH-82]|uniref:protein NO VEIN domain-containing protein n=1 Tax=Micromonospora sp. SH-82 TaxID=3132938 RepID=UPI003EBC5C49